MTRLSGSEQAFLRGRLRIDAFGLPEDFHIEKSHDSDLVIVKRKEGHVVIDGHNIIVNTGRERVLELVGGLSTKPFNRMGIGDDGVSALDILVPIAPTIHDTDLNHRLTTEAVSSITVGQEGTPSQWYIRYIHTFTALDYLGTPTLNWKDPAKMVINEAGIFTSDNVMLARKTFASIPFDPTTNVAIQFTWDIFMN